MIWTGWRKRSPRQPGNARSNGRAIPRLETLEARQVPSFLPPVPYGTGASPQAVVIGDLTGNGIPDLVVTNYSDGTVSVFRGVGDGTFDPAGSFPAGPTPNALALGDVKGDGVPDLAVTNNTQGSVSILLGNGDGSFGPPVPYGPTQAYPDAVVVGDFNGDGALDFATAAGGSRYVNVFLNQGDGTFGTPTQYNVGTILYGLGVGDFNGDGTPDLAVASFATSDVVILLGNGDGTFQITGRIPVGGADEVAVGDFHSDGTLDLAVTNNVGNMSVLLGNGDGSFQAPVVYTAAGTAVAVADVNGDGIPDLVTAGGNTIGVLLGNGDGTFQAPLAFDAGPGVSGVAAGDLSGDDYPDVVVTNASANTVSVLRNDGQWDTPGPAPRLRGRERAVELLPPRSAVALSYGDNPLAPPRAVRNDDPFLAFLETRRTPAGVRRLGHGCRLAGRVVDRSGAGVWCGLRLLSPDGQCADFPSPTASFTEYCP